MRVKPLLVIIVVLIPLLFLEIPSVSAAHTAQNLTLTTGTGSAWVTGGYNFAKTAKATKAGFKPFAAKSAITLDVWLKCNYHTGVQYLVSVYVSSTDNVKLIFSGSNVYFDVGANGVLSNARWDSILVNGSVYHLVGTWDKSSNGGKAELFLNGSKHIASTGTGAFDTGSNDDLWLSGTDGASNLWKGTLYSLAIYYEKWGYTEVNATHISRDTVLSTVDYYWTLNTGSGTTFYDWDDAWWPVENFNLDLVTKALEWYSIENWTLSLQTMQATWLRVELWLVNLLTHSLFPVFEQDSWFYVLIFAALGAIVCFALIAKMIADGDYDSQVMGLLFILGLFALLVVAGVILTV